MALKLVVNTGGTISHSPGSTTSGGSFTVTSPPSLKNKAEGSGVYHGTINFSFSGGNSTETFSGTGVVTPGTVAGSGTISASAISVKSEGQAIMLDGDSGSFSVLTGTFVPSATGTPAPGTPLPLTNVEFSDAGQTKVKAQ